MSRKIVLQGLQLSIDADGSIVIPNPDQQGPLFMSGCEIRGAGAGLALPKEHVISGNVFLDLPEPPQADPPRAEPPQGYDGDPLDPGPRGQLLGLLQTFSVQVRDEPFVLASGRKSRFYVDCRQTLLHPEGMQLAGSLMYEEWLRLAPSVGDLDGVAGPSIGADPLVCAFVLKAASYGQNVSGLFIRKEAKGHGAGNLIEGLRTLQHLTGEGPPRVLLLEDVITTGGSSIRSLTALRQAGVDVLHVLALVDRQEGGVEALAREGVPVSALYTKADFGVSEP